MEAVIRLHSILCYATKLHSDVVLTVQCEKYCQTKSVLFMEKIWTWQNLVILLYCCIALHNRKSRTIFQRGLMIFAIKMVSL